MVETDGDTDDGDEELADQHAQGTPDEERTTTELLDGPEGEWGGADIDEGKDQGDQEGVADSASGLQEWGRVVEDEVDTGPLLHHLQRGTQDCAADVGRLLEKGTLEAVCPAVEETSAGNDTALVLLVGDDLSKLVLDVLGLGWLTTESLKRSASIFESTLLDVVTWGVGKEEETTGEDDSPGELDTNGNAVRFGTALVLAGVDNAGSEKQTDGNTELVACYESTTNLLWALECWLVEGVKRGM